ncbi:Myb-like DNA-binding domain containing protein [Histomonas meleagridis]|uniref:Myb-like DNA-binding domain containing protein n=1 Tax=Histomonas meleagridis TaxID=135588 RepID=UPI0035598C03|nr:Myb-like DNA-binding domain containing protein [Histomonas meleagridis]KAH0806157.1 Myb-like DNA-binding domain containing protein [Histomonas meleagridis]
MTKISPLLDVAMFYVKQASFGLDDPSAKQEIMNAFNLFLNNLCDKNDVAAVLTKYIGSTQPLDRIVTILSVPDTPLPIQTSFNLQHKKTKPWSNIEDNRLLAGLHKFGTDNWVTIAKFVGNGRTRAQCAQRWFRGLDPKISKNQWSPEEEAKLIHLIKTSKNKGWTSIASSMGNRSDVQCRYHFLQMQKEGKIKEDLSSYITEKHYPKSSAHLGSAPMHPTGIPLNQLSSGGLVSSLPNFQINQSTPPPPPQPQNKATVNACFSPQPAPIPPPLPRMKSSSRFSTNIFSLPPKPPKPQSIERKSLDILSNSKDGNLFFDIFSNDFDQTFSNSFWDEEPGNSFMPDSDLSEFW